MGFDVNGVRFLVACKRQNVCFEQTAMLGRQELHLSPAVLARVLAKAGFTCNEQEARTICSRARGFAEPLLEKLGATEIESFDANSFEGATHVRDFNQPIDPRFHGRFSLVLDGGTLEHIFNFAVAVANGMRMVKVGGHFLAITPCNNFAGHGFYQFSPELFFRIFAPANGFDMEKLLLCESSSVSGQARWFEVAEPDEVQGRVEFMNAFQSYLFVLARKLCEAEPFAAAPQQGDYTRAWAKPSGKAPTQAVLPPAVLDNSNGPLVRLRSLVGRALRRAASRYDRKCFKPISPPA